MCCVIWLLGIPWWRHQIESAGNSPVTMNSLRWHHNGRDSVSNHQPHDCLLNRLFRRRSKKTSKLRVIGLCAGNSPGTGEFPAQMASNAENVSIWWRHHVPSQRPVTRSFDVSLICALSNGWVSNREAVDLRRHRAHFDVIVMLTVKWTVY